MPTKQERRLGPVTTEKRDLKSAENRTPRQASDRVDAVRVAWAEGRHVNAAPASGHAATKEVETKETEEAKREEESTGGAAAPAIELSVRSGAGLVDLTWTSVPGVIGYLIERADRKEGPYAVVNHGGGDVLAVPGPRYADTTGSVGQSYWYRVRPVRSLDSAPEQPDSDAEVSQPKAGRVDHRPPSEPIQMTVDLSEAVAPIRPLWHMLGSEHLSQLDSADSTGGRPIGEEFATSLSLARAELGTTQVRAHGILSTVEISGEGDRTTYDFSRAESLYGRLLAIGTRPVVELSFMPPSLARDPGAAVFTYPGVTSPPKDFYAWGRLVEAFATRLVERFGRDEVAEWGFEVWNEPNLSVFWKDGRLEDYLRLYEEAALAIRRVDPHLRVGGPASAAAAWLKPFLRYVEEKDLPLDFLSTHTYGNLPLDLRPLLTRYGRPEAEIWWTEWGVTPTHFHPVNDLPFAAPFVLHGMKRTQGLADSLAYWVVSDHFEELGRAPKLLHGGFGLLTVGNLRKPRFWALRFLEEMGPDARRLELDGDGAGSLVDAWATRRADQSVDVLAWNGTLDQSKMSGFPLLDRRLEIRIQGFGTRPRKASLARIDRANGNIENTYRSRSPFDHVPDWPSPELWAALEGADRPSEAEIMLRWDDVTRTVSFTVDLPMPGVARLRILP